MDKSGPKSKSLFVAPVEFFQEAVKDALTHRRVHTHPLAESYLAHLLEYYMSVDHLFNEEKSGQKQQETLAELFMRATNSEPSVKAELLKKLGDTSLYISGFFGDSLNKKVVDIDYYADMGGAAYNNLASVTREDSVKQVYGELSTKFLEFVDVLTYISNKTLIQNNENLLRLYERYVRTGSGLAREQLIEKGIVAPIPNLKKNMQ